VSGGGAEGERIALQGVTDAELAARAPAVTVSEARKLLAAVHRGGSIEPRPGLSRRAIEAALARGHVPCLTVVDSRASGRDGFHKQVLAAADGARFESVVMPLARPGRVSVCVSSQVGCALACAFCATGRLGLARNLEAWEMVEQVREARRAVATGARVHGVVFQGMGEPLANLERVAAAIAVMTAPYALAIDARAITVSTAGLPDGIRRLARLARRVRLAVSIGSARDDVRGRLMPISRAHPLDEVMDAAVEHARATRLAPMWAITLLAGVNDGGDDAEALAELAHRFRARAGVAPRVSVLTYNAIDSADRDPFRPASGPTTATFRDHLAARGIHTHRRYSGGPDIAAACGQLTAPQPP
jgi:23S rRNA (adenine2503-C2)-methyltransferase